MISNKKIKVKCWNKVHSQNKNRNNTEEKLAHKSSILARDTYRQELSDLITDNFPSSYKAHFIYIEKNHPPNAFKPLFELINKNRYGIDVKVVALTPLVDDNFITCKGKDITYRFPFSLNMFFTCFDRVQKREEHETLKGSGPESAGANVHFLGLFKDFELTLEELEKHGFNKLLRIPFTSEENPVVIPAELTNSFIEALNKTVNEDFDPVDDYYEDLNYTYEKFQLQFKDPNVELIKKHIEDFIQAEILPEIIPGYIAPSVQLNLDIVTKSDSINKEVNLQNKTVVQKKEEERKNEEKKEEASAVKTSEIPYTYKKKFPVFFGIFPINNSQQEFKNYISEGLKLLLSSFHDDTTLDTVYEDIQQDNPTQMTFTNDPHVTSSYIGDNEDKCKAYRKGFTQDYRISLELIGLVVVPNKTVIAFCYPDQSAIKIEDEFPHMVLMKGEWSLHSSHVILEEVFGKESKLRSQYCSKELAAMPKFTEKIEIEIPEGKGTAYIVISESPLLVSSEARASKKAPS